MLRVVRRLALVGSLIIGIALVACGDDDGPADVVRFDASPRDARTPDRDAGPMDASEEPDLGPSRVNATLEHVCGAPGDVALLLSADRRTDVCEDPNATDPEFTFPIHDGLPVVAPETFTRIVGARCQEDESLVLRCAYADATVTFDAYDEVARTAAGTFDFTAGGVRYHRFFEAEWCPPHEGCPPAGAPDGGAPPPTRAAGIFHTCDPRRGLRSMSLHVAVEGAPPCSTREEDVELSFTVVGVLPVVAPSTYYGTDGLVTASHCAPDGASTTCTEGQGWLVFDTYDESANSASGRYAAEVDGEVYAAPYDATICDPGC